MSKTDKWGGKKMERDVLRIIREDGIAIHVAMNYIACVANHKDNANRNMNRIAKKLNRAIGDAMALPKTWRKLK